MPHFVQTPHPHPLTCCIPPRSLLILQSSPIPRVTANAARYSLLTVRRGGIPANLRTSPNTHPDEVRLTTLHGYRQSPSLSNSADTGSPAAFRHVSRSRDISDVIHMTQRGRQPAVHTEDLACHNRRDGQSIESIDECLPHLDITPAFALVIEAVDSCDVGTLMQNGLETLLASVHVVTQKQKVAVWRETTHLEHTDQVRVLAVDISDDLDGRAELEKSGLREEELPCRIADSRDLSVLEADGLRDFTSIASVHEALDHVIQIGRLQCAY
ncbi:phosphoprotein phosphatase PPZ [Hortaea werneckii]|nr:phosphoprotein phosphatase PPZ [Hortaea werneckii]